MEFVYNDGGRSKYFKATNVGDCVTRAICNATELDYKEVYKALQNLENTMKVGKRETKGSARNGIRKKVDNYYIEKVLGWIRVTTCRPGSSERVHLTEDEMPKKGTYIVQLSKHLTCLKDGIIYDTYNCSKQEYYDDCGDLQINDKRLVYGYWRAPSEEEHKSQLNEIKLKEEQEKQKKLAKEKNKKIKSQYAKKIKVLQQKIKALEKERDSKLISL